MRKTPMLNLARSRCFGRLTFCHIVVKGSLHLAETPLNVTVSCKYIGSTIHKYKSRQTLYFSAHLAVKVSLEPQSSEGLARAPLGPPSTC